MSGSGASGAFRRWLASAEGLAAMTRAARSLVRDLRNLHLRAALERFGIDAATPFEVAVDEVRGELYRYVLEHENRLAPRMAALAPRSAAYLRQAFLNHCRETERQRGGDAFRFHYRRAAEALRRDGRFATRPVKRGGLAYSLSENSRDIGPLSDEDLAEAVPKDSGDAPGGVPYKRHAEQMWQALSHRFGGAPIWILVRDLVRWLDFHGRLPSESLRTVPLSDAVARKTAAVATTPFDPAAVRRWARMFAATLRPSDRRLLFLRYGRDLGFKAIAQDLGTYRSASGAHARMQRIEEMLCDFIQTHGLPWLGPDDLDEEAFALFSGALLNAVEKPSAAPSDMHKTSSPSARQRPRNSK